MNKTRCAKATRATTTIAALFACALACSSSPNENDAKLCAPNNTSCAAAGGTVGSAGGSGSGDDARTTGGISGSGSVSGSGGTQEGTGSLSGGEGGTGGDSPPGSGGNSGGTPGLGGSPAGGSATGGSVSEACGPACSNEASGSCSAPRVRITEIDLGVPVVVNESETELRHLSLAATPSGGARLAFMGEGDEVHVAHLGCDDALMGTPFTLPAHDYQDIAADDNGGVVVLTRDARGGGTLNCGEPANLCDGGPDPAVPCHEMWMARFDCAGNEVWTAPLTTSTEELPPYSTGPTGETSLMIWWYQHQGRLAFDGENYAAYFGVAISISEDSCINIHQGDRMVVVAPDGGVLEHQDDFGNWGVGCSHSWNTRIVWDESEGKFVMVCGTDNEGRVAMPDPYRTIYVPSDLSTLNVGGLVIAQGGGYWLTASDLGTVHLLHFSDGLADQDIEIASSNASHLVPYGVDNMLLAWQNGDKMRAQVLSRSTGDSVSEEFSIDVPGNQYQSFEEMKDGGVAFAAPGSTSTSVRIARVLPCE